MVSGRLKLYLNSEGVSYALFYNSFYSHKIMRAVIQKVTQAKVDVLSENSCETCGEINNGFMILLGVTHTDTEIKFIAQRCRWLDIASFPFYPLRRCAQRPPPIFLQCRARRTSG